MVVCKTCGTKFHYCSSCGCDGYSEYDYCSPECMDLAEEFKELKDILDSLNTPIRTRLINLLKEMPESMIEHVMNLYS